MNVLYIDRGRQEGESACSPHHPGDPGRKYELIHITSNVRSKFLQINLKVMMTLTNNVAAKFAVAFVAVAMMFTAIAPASAQNVEDMSLEELIALITALEAQLSTPSTGGAMTTSCFTFTRDLTLGSTGPDVMELQKFMMAAGQSIPAGPTDYFGGQTQAALASWQASKAITPAVGYFGPITRAAVAIACVPSTPSTPTDEEDEDEDDSSVTLRGEASIGTFDIDSASEDEIEEGAEDAPIAELTVEFSNGDAEISRMDFTLVGTGDERDPWDTFETMSLWVDGDKIAEMDIDNEDDYLDEDAGTLRFSGLDLVAMEDEEVEIVVAVTVLNSVDGTTDGEAWTVSADTMRFFDADGVATTDDGAGDLGDPRGATESFTVTEAGAEDEVIVKTSSSDPDATTLQVEDDSKSDFYTVFVFDLDTDDSDNDIEFDGITLTLNTSIAYGTLVDDVELVIDGTTIDDVTASTSVNGLVTDLVFDVDGDVTVDAGDRVEAELMVRFKSLASANEGATVQGLLTSTQADLIDAEGADDLGTSQLSGAATGDTHTLRSTGISVEAASDSAVVTTSDGALNDYVTFKVEVDVTAFDQDVFIPIDSASTTWSLRDSAGNVLTVPAASTSVIMSSSAQEGGAGDAFFEINEGETETITLTVTYTPSIANTAVRLQLGALLFDETGTVTGADDQTWTATPLSDYRTDVVTIVN